MDAMMSGMSAMMGWMMGINLLAWALLFGLLVAIVFALLRFFSSDEERRERRDSVTRTKP
jgi:hypothetical protein